MIHVVMRRYRRNTVRQQTFSERLFHIPCSTNPEYTDPVSPTPPYPSPPPTNPLSVPLLSVPLPPALPHLPPSLCTCSASIASPHAITFRAAAIHSSFTTVSPLPALRRSGFIIADVGGTPDAGRRARPSRLALRRGSSVMPPAAIRPVHLRGVDISAGFNAGLMSCPRINTAAARIGLVGTARRPICVTVMPEDIARPVSPAIAAWPPHTKPSTQFVRGCDVSVYKLNTI